MLRDTYVCGRGGRSVVKREIVCVSTSCIESVWSRVIKGIMQRQLNISESEILPQ